MYEARLRAINVERNARRSYLLRCHRDLLGDWLVVVDWGRIGTRTRERVEVYGSEEEARHRVQELLRRRKTARRRIGVDYTVLWEDGRAWLTPPPPDEGVIEPGCSDPRPPA